MENLISIINQLISLFLELENLQKNKLKAITENNLKALEESMKQEQVFIMKLKGLDKKRDTTLQSLGYENLTFKEIIASITDEVMKNDLASLYTDLELALKNFQVAQNSVKTLLESNIHAIDMIFENAGVANNNSSSILTNKKI